MVNMSKLAIFLFYFIKCLHIRLKGNLKLSIYIIVTYDFYLRCVCYRFCVSAYNLITLRNINLTFYENGERIHCKPIKMWNRGQQFQK